MKLRVEATLKSSQLHSGADGGGPVRASVREWMNLKPPPHGCLDAAPEVKWKLADAAALQFSAQKVNLAPGASQKIVLTRQSERTA